MEVSYQLGFLISTASRHFYEDTHALQVITSVLGACTSALASIMDIMLPEALEQEQQQKVRNTLCTELSESPRNYSDARTKLHQGARS